ncbi:sushi domain-containing protein 6 isoform X1 [Gopherus flavomarginatus]|uniref:sushi domain-containing protein 6 isoform X1 n=1 Tax=Gopherus flavomarginatus TaxID=286002 RepID=UPI0021CBF738|nr:sushi domain-containing protein 6 isoform X1 [Gopherus flavomarginatus]XP_050809545.1 sushi domain-containing protein 6 isoform X1 [Gopherus flavomarginatus]
MCHGMVAPKSNTASPLALTGHGLFLPLIIFSSFILEGLTSVCPHPPEPENGGYKCHPTPCSDPLTSDSVIEYVCDEGYMLKGDYKYLTCKNGEWNPAMEISCRLSQVCPRPPEPENGGYKCHPTPCSDPLTSDSVIEYVCDEGYMLKGDYKYLTCKNGEWNPAMEISCRLSQDKDSPPTIGVPTLSIVASTASSVALILLLVVLFVLLQPKLKSFHHSRRDQGVSGDQVSMMVDGVQVALPSYEEAVYGSAGNCIPPSDSRVQIVLSEGAGQSGTSEMQQQDQGARDCFVGEDEAPGRSGLCEASGSQLSETVLVHQATTSSWVAGMASSRPVHKDAQDSESSDIQSLLSLTSSEEYTDDIPLLKEA